MNRKWILAAVLALAVPTVGSANDTVRTLNQQFDAANLDHLELEFPVGQLVVDAWDRPQVQIEVRLQCGKKEGCREAAKAVQLVSQPGGKELELELKGWPKNNSKGLEAHVQIHAPRQLAVDAELGVGKLRINGMASHVDAEVGVGDIDLSLPEAAVATVSLEAGVGGTSLKTKEKSYSGSNLVGKELRWRAGAGAGKADVHAESGVGDVRVALN